MTVAPAQEQVCVSRWANEEQLLTCTRTDTHEIHRASWRSWTDTDPGVIRAAAIGPLPITLDAELRFGRHLIAWRAGANSARIIAGSRAAALEVAELAWLALHHQQDPTR